MFAMTIRDVRIYIFAAAAITLAAALSLTPAHEDPSPRVPPAPSRIYFEANPGTQAGFIGRGANFALALTPHDATLILNSTSGPVPIRLSFANAHANTGAAVTAPASGVAHYYLGKNPDAWRRNVALHERVRYAEVYPGIDVLFYGNETRFEYDFIVSPGADPADIVLRFDGTRRLEVDASGDLLLHTDAGVVRQPRPQIYQENGTARSVIDGAYVIGAANEVRFRLGGYDPTRTLVIDPILDYATFLGGNGGDFAQRVAVDANGNMIVAGFTFSTDLAAAITHGTAPGDTDPRQAFVSKYDANGTLIFNAYLGGTAGDIATDVVVNAAGDIYVSGETSSGDFPVTTTQLHGGDVDAFVAVLGANGATLKYARYLGGSEYDVAHGIALGLNGLVYLAGETWSANFPVTTNAYAATCGGCGGTAENYDGFLAVLDISDTAKDKLTYATFFGGSGNDKIHAVAVASTGTAYVVGETNSTNMPIPNAVQFKNGGSFDVLFAAFDPQKSAADSLLYATYFGGSGDDAGEHVAINSAGHVYIAGTTQSSDFPVKNAYQETLRGSQDAFVLKLLPSASSGSSLLYATYFGGMGEDSAESVAADTDDSAVFAGMTTSTDLPVKATTQNVFSGGDNDAYAAKLGIGGNTLRYSTYLGGQGDDSANGIAIDANSYIYVTGDSDSENFPLAGTGAQTSKYLFTDATLVRLDPSDPPPPVDGASNPPPTGNKTKGGGAFDLLLLGAAFWLRRRRREHKR